MLSAPIGAKARHCGPSNPTQTCRHHWLDQASRQIRQQGSQGQLSVSAPLANPLKTALGLGQISGNIPGQSR